MHSDASAYEYFKDQFLMLGAAPQCQMTEACLNYISHSISSPGLMYYARVNWVNLDEISRLQTLYPLLSYAFCYWGNHAHAIKENFNHDLLHNLAQNGNILQFLLKEYQQHFRLSYDDTFRFPSTSTFKLILVFFDLSGLLASKFDLALLVKEKLDKQRTYLMYSAGWGQPSTTTWLVGAESSDALSTESEKVIAHDSVY